MCPFRQINKSTDHPETKPSPTNRPITQISGVLRSDWSAECYVGQCVDQWVCSNTADLLHHLQQTSRFNLPQNLHTPAPGLSVWGSKVTTKHTIPAVRSKNFLTDAILCSCSMLCTSIPFWLCWTLKWPFDPNDVKGSWPLTSYKKPNTGQTCKSRLEASLHGNSSTDVHFLIQAWG